jgi:sedoheptulokinase
LRTGYQLSTGYGCATLAWLVRHGAMPPEAIGAATIHDLAVARLSGLARPVTDPTDAASWGLFDLASLAWDGAAVAAAGIPPKLLPEVHPCGSRAGALAAEMAARLGLPAGIPVAVAIGDNQASLLATLREPEKELALTLGTGGQVSAVLAAGAAIDWRKAPAAHEYRPYPGGRYAVVAASLCGGAAWAWLADSIGRWMSDLGVVAPDRDELFAMLNVLGLESPDIVEVRPDLRGSIEGLTLGNFTLGAVAKGLARGILTNLRDMLPHEVLMGRAPALPSKAGLRRGGSSTSSRTPRLRTWHQGIGWAPRWPITSGDRTENRPRCSSAATSPSSKGRTARNGSRIAASPAARHRGGCASTRSRSTKTVRSSRSSPAPAR